MRTRYIAALSASTAIFPILEFFFFPLLCPLFIKHFPHSSLVLCCGLPLLTTFLLLRSEQEKKI